MRLGPQHYFGSGGETDLHPAAIVILLIATVLVLALPRRYAFVPLLVASLFVPSGQQIVIGGLHLTLLRILIFFAWARLIWTKVTAKGMSMPKWTGLDMVFLAYFTINSLTFLILWEDVGALINRLGVLFNACGTYFYMRHVLRDERDLDRVTKTFAWVMVVMAVFMLNEQFTGRNVFSIFGGVPALTEVRGDKLRSQGPFAHTLTAGSTGAVLFPLFFGLWWQGRKNKTIALLGAVSAVIVAVSSMSSTPFLVLVAGMFALAMWPLRSYLSWIRWGTVGLLVCLQLVMKAPIWALISRIDLTGSSSSYHRYELVNQFILRFGEWWLVGTRDTANWGWDMWDTINAYVSAGTNGGLICFLLFLAIVIIAFRDLAIARKTRNANVQYRRRMWTLTAMLFANAVAFWGIEYFDQSALAWYTELAMIATAVGMRPSKPRPERTPTAVEMEDPARQPAPEVDHRAKLASL